MLHLLSNTKAARSKWIEGKWMCCQSLMKAHAGTITESSHLTNFRKGLKTSRRCLSIGLLISVRIRNANLCFIVRSPNTTCSFLCFLGRAASVQADAHAAGMGKETTEAGRRCLVTRGARGIITEVYHRATGISQRPHLNP